MHPMHVRYGPCKPLLQGSIMASFLLTSEELEVLSGYRKPTAQSRWLKQNDFPFVLGGDGRPKVLRQVVEARLGGKVTEIKREPQLRLPSGRQS